jgi:hypothetical protein
MDTRTCVMRTVFFKEEGTIMEDRTDPRLTEAAQIAADALGVDPRRSGTARLARDLGNAVLRQHTAKPRYVMVTDIVVPMPKPKATT